MSPVTYFAYGSNMATRELRRKGLAPISSQIALLRDYDIAFDVRFPLLRRVGGLATIFPQEGNCVYGVMHVLPAHQLFILDLWEFSILGIYKREKVEIELTSSMRQVAQTYISAIRGNDCKPSSAYQRKISEGIDEFGLPAEWASYLQAKAQLPTKIMMQNHFRRKGL